MKTTLLILLLTGAGLWAQTPPAPAFTELPTNAPSANTNHNDLLRQALRQALASKTNVTIKAAALNPATNGVATGVPTASPAPPAAAPALPAVAALGSPAPPTNVSADAAAPRTNLPAIPDAPPAVAAPGTNRPAIPGGLPTAAAPRTNVTAAPAPLPGAAAPPPGASAVPAAAVTPAPSPADQTAGTAPASGATNVAEEQFVQLIELRGENVNNVLDVYAALKNRTILRSANLPAPQIWLKTQTPLTKREAIEAFDAVLGMNGISMIDIGEKFVKAVPEATAGQAGAKLTAEQLGDLGPYVTQVIQLNYARPTELVAVLQPFSKIPNAILPIESSQILVLRDYTENVKRMLEMIKKVDVVVPSEFIEKVIPIRYALASEIAGALNSLSTGGGTTSVGRAAGGGATGRAPGGAFGRGAYGAGGGYPGATTPGMTTPFGTAPGGQPATPQATATPGGSFADRLRSVLARSGAGGEMQILGQTKIIADERTNSLLIFATKEDMARIEHLISELDVVLAQVLIEAAIIEITLDNSKSLGFSYVQPSPQGGNYFKGIGAINNGNILNANSFLSGVATNGAGNIPGGFSYLATLNNDLDVSITAAASDSRAKILQRPRIQTSHAVPAHLFVGQSRPYPTASYYGGGAYGGYASIQQMQIGVTLDITPLINTEGLVVMDIQQQIDSVAGTVNIVNVGDVPITSSKSASAKVAVHDHDTIMLGGLIETDKTDSRSGVPFLMDIPGLGFLFRTTSKTETRNEFIVLIRPTVLPTPEIAALAAKAEQNKLPGVRQAEKEDALEEANRFKHLNRN